MYRDKSALSALIVSSSKQAADYLRGILEGLRFHPIAEVVSIAEAKRRELETPSIYVLSTRRCPMTSV